MKDNINILYLIIFIGSIWTVNTTISPNINSAISKIKESRKDLYIKQSFNEQDNLVYLSKSIDNFVPEKLDKVQLSNLIANLAQKSLVEIESLDIKESKESNELTRSNINYKSNNKDILAIDEIWSNTLKEVNISLSIKGEKMAIYSFCSKLSKSPQYMNISSLNIKFSPLYTVNNISNDNNIVSGNIIIKTYYKKL